MADHHPTYRLDIDPAAPTRVVAAMLAEFHQRTTADHPETIDAACLDGQLQRLGDQLVAVMAGLGVDYAFSLAEEPSYELLGLLLRYSPGLGFHLSDCDATLQPVMTDRVITDLIADTATPEQVIAQIRAHLGGAWPASASLQRVA